MDKDAHHKRFMSLKGEMDARRTQSDRVADGLTSMFGTTAFFFVNAIFFTLWMSINSGLISAIPVFDPYPFNFLTMVVSLEAIFLSIFVLISQNRASRLGDLREEVDLHLNIQAEEEITRVLIMLDQIHDKLGLNPEDDRELKKMKKRTNVKNIEDIILKEIE